MHRKTPRAGIKPGTTRNCLRADKLYIRGMNDTVNEPIRTQSRCDLDLLDSTSTGIHSSIYLDHSAKLSMREKSIRSSHQLSACEQH